MACDDGDPCTHDVCNPPAGCTHEAAVGLDAASCQVEGALQTIEASPPEDLGGASAQAQLDKRISRVLRLLEKAKISHGRLARANPRRARHLLMAFVRTVRKGEIRGVIEPDVADLLLAQAEQAIAVLLSLQSGTTQ